MSTSAVNTSSNQILEKLDKIIELLERLSDKDEDKLLLELEKKGFFQLILDEAKLNSSTSDWQRELDEI